MFLKVLRVMYHMIINLTKELFNQKLVIKLYARAVIPEMGIGKLTSCLEGTGSPCVPSYA